MTDKLERFPSEATSKRHHDDPRFPYKYSTDLHWLWAWGQRIDTRLMEDTPADDRLSAVLYPDTLAKNALMRLGIDFQHIIRQVDRQLDCCLAAFDELNGQDAASESLFREMAELRDQIMAGAATIAQAQAKPVASSGRGEKTGATITWKQARTTLEQGCMTVLAGRLSIMIVGSWPWMTASELDRL